MEHKFEIESQVWKHNKIPIDLFQHCLELKRNMTNLKAFVGCDSISVAGKITYFTVISFREGNRGVHCIHTKDVIPSIPTKDKSQKIASIFKKLERECEITMAVATYLVKNKIFDIKDVIVEFDYNEIPEEVSNRLIGTAKGWAEYEGFQHLCKIPHNHTRPKKTPVENMVCVGNAELDEHGRPKYPGDWTDIQSSCRYADHLCRSV